MKLLSCPFCGNEDLKLHKILSDKKKIVVGIYILCEPEYKPCGAQGPIRDTVRAAKAAWNKQFA